MDVSLQRGMRHAQLAGGIQRAALGQQPHVMAGRLQPMAQHHQWTGVAFSAVG
ncbi:hypothetical protein QT383_16560 [Stenotrophomonas rhizophila]